MLMGLKTLVIVLVLFVSNIFAYAEEYDKTSFYVAYNVENRTEYVLVMPMVNKVYTHKAGEIGPGDLTQIGDQFNAFPTYSSGELCFSELHSSATGEAGASVMAGKCYSVDFFYTQKKSINEGVAFMLYYKPQNKVYEGLAGKSDSFLVVRDGDTVINKNSITDDDYSYFNFYTNTAMLTLNISDVPEKPKLSSVINKSGDGNITITWEEVSQSTQYNLYWKTENNATWHKIADTSSSYIHENTEDNVTYSYYVTALNSIGESNVSNTMSVTTRSPKISGTAFSFDSDWDANDEINGTGVARVCLLDMNYSVMGECIYNLVENNTSLELQQSISFNFDVKRDTVYLLYSALYDSNTMALGALTQPVTADTEQNITFESDLVFSLLNTNLYHNGKISNDLKLDGLTYKELSIYLEKSQKAVDNYMDFIEDPNSEHGADRIVDGLYNMSRDFLNARSEFNITNKAVLRAYGGYMDDEEYTRTLDDILDDPIRPLNPGFLFAAQKNLTSGGSEVVLGFSEVDLERWDFVGKGYMPHMNVGGDRMVYQSDYYNSAYGIIYIETLGENNKKVRISPIDMHCNYPEISPDGKTVVMSCIKPDNSGKATYLMGPENIYTVSVDGSWDYPVDSLKAITTDTEINTYFYEKKNLFYYGNSGPTWSKDGRYIYFIKLTENSESTNFLTVIRRYDTQNKILKDLITLSGVVFGNDLVIAPDTKHGYISAFNFDNGTMDIYKINFDPKAFTAERIAGSPSYSEWYPSISYDGSFIFYTQSSGLEPASIKLINRYTFEEVYDFGDFANASAYFTPLLTATTFAMVAEEEYDTDEKGVVDTGTSDTRTTDFDGFSDHERIYDQTNTALRSSGMTMPYMPLPAW